MTNDKPYFPSRRDYFAGFAMQALMGAGVSPFNGMNGMEHVTAHAAFTMADEMCSHEQAKPAAKVEAVGMDADESRAYDAVEDELIRQARAGAIDPDAIIQIVQDALS